MSKYYVVFHETPRMRQMTLEEVLFADEIKLPSKRHDRTATRVFELDSVSDRIKGRFDTISLYSDIVGFVQKNSGLFDKDRESLYRTFHLPKKSGRGLRRIDAPIDELKNPLRELKEILEKHMLTYHTSAFAYVKGRSTLDDLKKHQANESKWFAKYDVSNFFGSITLEFTVNMCKKIFPLSEMFNMPEGGELLTKALSLGFYNGGLPQGTPLSPTLTNILMIPIDFCISRGLRNEMDTNIVYTRYADDFLVTSKFDFDFKKAESVIVDVLNDFGAPMRLNAEKTRYGSSSGANWNLGMMLNKDNEITIGHKAKKRLKSMLFNYAMDRKNGDKWEINDIQVLEGNRAYARSIEEETIDKIVDHLSQKVGFDIVKAIKADLKSQYREE